MKQIFKGARLSASRFVQDESGFVLPLAIILTMLILLMGMGLLVFADAGLNSAAQTNRGQTGFDTADAGMQAARQQLYDNTQSEDYDGNNAVTPDVQWSSSKGGMNLTFPENLGSAKVTIQYVSGQNFAVVSTGSSGDAKRKIAATLTTVPSISTSVPAVFFSWGNLSWSGGGSGPCNLGNSIFLMGSATVTGSVNICPTMDPTYGLWAQVGTGGGPYPNAAGSYPNFYNPTPRTDAGKVAGIGAVGGISTSGGATAAIARGSRSYDNDTCPTFVKAYDSGVPKSGCTTKMTFPFMPSATPPPSDTETLRQRALLLEKQKPGTSYYFDSIPGNGVDDPGMTSDRSISTWPSNTDYQTVVFYKFALPLKTATWNIAGSCSTSSPYKGVLAVENGNVSLGGNSGGFNGAIVIRGPGEFTSSGTSCMTGYVNSFGNLNMGGSFLAGVVPPLTSLTAFEGSNAVAVKNWQEVYTP
jgi:hypothetical protein